MPQDKPSPFIYTVCRLEQPIDLKNLRKLRGALGRYMLQYSERQYHKSITLDNSWLYGHGAGSSRDVVPLIGFRLDDTGAFPEVCVRREASSELLDLLSAAPFQLTLGRKSYKVQPTNVYQHVCPGVPEPKVYTYRLEHLVPFSKRDFAQYAELRARHGYQKGSNYEAVDHPELLQYICAITRRHLERAYLQQLSNQEAELAQAGMPAGSLLHLDVTDELTHSSFYGSGNIRFSSFSGLQLRTNLKLGHHWGIGLERVHGAGRLIRIGR